MLRTAGSSASPQNDIGGGMERCGKARGYGVGGRTAGDWRIRAAGGQFPVASSLLRGDFWLDVGGVCL